MFKILFTLLFIISSLGIPKASEDGYLNFFNYVHSHIHHWNPQIKDPEISAYCKSVWKGCEGNLKDSKNYFYVCVKEQGVRNRDLFDRHGGYGYSGATSKTVKRATYGKSRKWVRKHPFLTNEALAFYFHHTLKANPLWWYSSPDPDKMSAYGYEIEMIREYCEK